MALKQCDYCRTFSDSKNTHCPSCSAPLGNKIIPEDGNIKETVSATVSNALNKAATSINNALKPPPPRERETAATAPAKVSDGKRYLNKWIVLVLAIVGGYLGVHRFYEGKIFSGIIYIFTFGFFGIGILIDIFCILGKPTVYPAKR